MKKINVIRGVENIVYFLIGKNFKVNEISFIIKWILKFLFFFFNKWILVFNKNMKKFW